MLTVTEKLKTLLTAIDTSRISATPGELPQLMELKMSIIRAGSLAKDNQPFEERLKAALEKLPAIREYFTTNPGAMNVISALNQLEDEIKELLPKDRPKVR